MKRKNRVRYIRLSVTALEIIKRLSESDKARFLDHVLHWFYQLETGGALNENIIDDDSFFALALAEELPELTEGYEQFKRLSSGQRSTKGQPEVNQRSPIEENRTEENREKEIISDYGYHQAGGLDEAEEEDVSIRLDQLGVTADDGFWNTCHRYGYKAVSDALDFAEGHGIASLKRITKMIANGTDY